MTGPDRDAQEKFTQAYVADLAPQGAVETQLAQSLAFDAWRMNRIRAIEENAFAHGFAGQPGDIECGHPEIHSAMAATLTFFNDPAKFVLLSLYEQRIHRNFHRNLKAFHEMRQARPAAPRETGKPLTMAAGQPTLANAQTSDPPASPQTPENPRTNDPAFFELEHSPAGASRNHPKRHIGMPHWARNEGCLADSAPCHRPSRALWKSASRYNAHQSTQR
jgi:hypothetical protein